VSGSNTSDVEPPMNATHHCPTCGNPLPPDAPQGECPRCLLRAGLESEPAVAAPVGSASVATGSYGWRALFQPPSVAELQARIPQYEILELIGQGGMGAVYKARQPGLGRFVAIKILPFEINQSPGFTERFAREARALALLSHPHIVAVHDFGQAGDMCYFVMEYVDGVNLRQALQAKKMDTREALAIVPQICDALQFAHDEGVVHRDIKPENILIDKRGRVKIADFGLAKLLGPDPSGLSLTGTLQVMGTLRYMAPEQMSGAKEVDHRADIFSLGVVFYELLTGELPIGRFAPPSKKAQIDARLDDVVLRALESEPDLRYQQVSEMKTGVEATRLPAASPVIPAPIAAQPAHLPEAEADPNRFWGTPVSMALCLLLSLMLLTFLAYTASPVLTMLTGPDTALIRFGEQWGLGNRVDKVTSSLFVVFVVLVSSTLWCWWKYQSAHATQPSRPVPPRIAAERRREGALSEDAGVPDSGPQLSKAALWGAILVPLFILALLAFAVTSITVFTPVAMHHGEGPPVAVRPMWIGMIILIPLGIVMFFGFLSPFLTTILGVVAISNIRHSRGKLYGMPLAVFDALFYPLLLLDLILVGAGWLLIRSVSTLELSMAITFLLFVPLTVLLNVILIRLSWRAAIENMPGPESDLPAAKQVPGKQPPPFQPQRQGTSVLMIVLILCAVGAIPFLVCAGVLGTYWIVPSRSVQKGMIIEEHRPYVSESTPVLGPGDGVPAKGK
jgi:serine/threonine protein kinase